MNFLFNNLSLGAYSVIIIFFGVVLIYGIIDMKKKKPRHPFINALYGLLIVGFYTIPYRFIKEYSSNLILKNISEQIMMVIMFSFLITFVYFAYLAYKKGFLDEKGKQLMCSAIIPCAIIFVICVVIIVTYIVLKRQGIVD